MKDTYTFDVFDTDIALKHASDYAKEKFTTNLSVVLSVAFKDQKNLPTLRFKQKDEVVLKNYIKKWVDTFLKGYENRPTKRVGNKSATFPDSIVKLILSKRLPEISTETADSIEAGHSLMMTIENIVGDLLEEYLSIKLASEGWYCCWGSTIDAVDFCKSDGSLLQVKNSDNSENSSSSRVRAGTTIEKWFRRVSTKLDTHNWAKLNTMVGRTDLSEDGFKKFVVKTIQENPGCIFINDDLLLNSNT